MLDTWSHSAVTPLPYVIRVDLEGVGLDWLIVRKNPLRAYILGWVSLWFGYRSGGQAGPTGPLSP